MWDVHGFSVVIVDSRIVNMDVNWPANCHVANIGCHQKPRNSFHRRCDMTWHSFCSLFNSIPCSFHASHAGLFQLLWPSSTLTFFPNWYYQDLSWSSGFAPAALRMPDVCCVRWPAQPQQTRPRRDLGSPKDHGTFRIEGPGAWPILVSKICGYNRGCLLPSLDDFFPNA